MPLYEYQCNACSRRIEKIQKFSDPELTVCPHCGGVLERTLTAPAVHFAGGGWYKDLYSSAKPAAPPTEGSGSATAPSSGSDSGGSTPAATNTASTAPAAAPAAATPSASTPSKS
ncbi:MAG TPA: zinc ribbon domain-containing protein [Acidobacteriaceae bacterium]|jgi:putative FmdB family regulatory protein